MPAGIRAIDPPQSLPRGRPVSAPARPLPPPPPSARIPPGHRERADSGTHSDESDDEEYEEYEYYDDVSSSDATESVSPIEKKQIDKGSAVDNTLWEIANVQKARKPSLHAESSLSSADSSGRHKARRSVGDAFKSRSGPAKRVTVSKLPTKSKPPPRQRQAPPKQISRAPPPPSLRPPRQPSDDDEYESDEEYSYEEDSESDDSEPGGSAITFDPLEQETLKAVRKAKLLARIEQMIGKGLKPSKTYNFRTNEDELLVEVARLEVMSERAIRVEQGRSVLMTGIKATEQGACFVDRNKWLPFEFNLKDFANHVLKEIDKYDDCLERGVAETIGSSGSKVWWIELLYILIPSMIMYSITNRSFSDPKYASEMLRQSPEFQERLAKEYAKEFAHTERQERERIERELRETRAQLSHIESNGSYNPTITQPAPPPQTSRSGVPMPKIGQMQPPPKKIPSANPMGDYPVNDAETKNMMAFIAQQQRQQQPNVTQTVRNEVRKELQNVQQNILESQKKPQTPQTPQPRQRQQNGTIRPPPRPSQAPRKPATMTLDDDDDE